MKRRLVVFLNVAWAALAWHSAALAQPVNPVVRFDTTLGSFRVELFETEAPLTVANFLNYVTAGRYQNSFVHRSMPGFVIQGGGHTYPSDVQGVVPVTPFAPVVDEPGIPNTRGTIAMARSALPNSATSQWYINLADNSALLGSQGFTVFGQVLGNGMAAVDDIAGLPRVNAGTPFGELPVRNYTSGPILKSNLVIVGIQVVPEPASVSLIAIGLIGLSRFRQKHCGEFEEDLVTDDAVGPRLPPAARDRQA